jgi:ribosome-binding protein aMBF1 (putative translation factor)
MNVPQAPSANSYDDRIEHRMEHKSTAVANRIRTLLGDMDQTDLVDRVGKKDSTISDHLSGTANLTLQTIAEYEAALENSVVMVPNLERSGRRRRATGENGVSKERKEMKENIDPAKRRLQRLLTNVAARIGQVLAKREDMSQQALADRLEKDPSYVSRVLGGGVNLTLKTIVQFEKALGVCILQVKGVPPKGTFSGRREASGYVQPYRSSNDGCYLDDHGGRTSTGMTNWLETKDEDRVSDEPEMVAA